MAHDRAFDRYSHIDYKDITRLFWDIYPYRVRLKAKNYDTAPIPFLVGNTQESQQAWANYRRSRMDFYCARLAQCPEHSDWRSIQHNDGLTFSFFFLHRDDATAFIRKNSKLVIEVSRANSDAEINALAANRRLVLRDMLYFNRYRYCIEFKKQPDTDCDDLLDNRIYELFQEQDDTDRYFLSLSTNRRLYLNNENDIIYVKLALFEHFHTQTQVLLKEEVQ